MTKIFYTEVEPPEEPAQWDNESCLGYLAIVCRQLRFSDDKTKQLVNKARFVLNDISPKQKNTITMMSI